MCIDPIKSVFYQTYLLQLEEYNLKSFNTAVQKSGGNVPSRLRRRINWTPKMVGIFILAHGYRTLFALGTAFFVFPIVGLLFAGVVFIGLMYISALLFFMFLALALYTIAPVDAFIKKSVINSAKTKLRSYPNLTIIGIAGSYGKTTMKEVLATILSQKFNVMRTPKNINTPLGISRQIVEELNNDVQIYIVEMGEYYPGDIASMCHLTPPHIAVVTGINEAHLEKMGSLVVATKAIFEVVVHSRPDSLIILNNDNERVRKNYQEYIGKRKLIIYSNKQTTSGFKAKNLEFHEDDLRLSFDVYRGEKKLTKCVVKFLGEYIVGDILAVFEIGHTLGMTVEEMKRGVEQLKPVEHRLQPIYNSSTDVLVIDDSYNGNPHGVAEAIKVLSYFKRRRKIFITPGLVETAEKNKQIHYNIGEKLSGVADKVVLIKNSATPHIAEGLQNHGFKEENIIWFESAQEAHDNLAQIIKPKDVVLFQNDWPDNYF